jgi:hypothetical protein
MCNFCENIITKEYYESLSFSDKDKLPLAFIMSGDNKYNLWCECDDYYYSGNYLTNIKYCPYCGRPLV